MFWKFRDQIMRVIPATDTGLVNFKVEQLMNYYQLQKYFPTRQGWYHRNVLGDIEIIEITASTCSVPVQKARSHDWSSGTVTLSL